MNVHLCENIWILHNKKNAIHVVISKAILSTLLYIIIKCELILNERTFMRNYLV